MNQRIVIVGGGPVGLAFALAASRLKDVDVTVIEKGPASDGDLPQPFDHRVYALSPASLAFLPSLAKFQQRIAPVRAMQVFGDDGESELDFEAGQPLATIVEHAVVMDVLREALSKGGRVDLRCGITPIAPIEMQSGDDHQRTLGLSDGTKIESDLLIAADGAHSQIRDWAGIAHTDKDYESDGVVANFRCERSHGDVARQWFRDDSVLAFLPLPDNHVSIVWSMTKSHSHQLPVDDAAFAEAVTGAGHRTLGAMTLVSPVARFPLARIAAKQWVQPGLALMGDAAHAVHPLAGQGVNLGFADARMMCDILAARSRFSGMGDLALLRKYERARREAAFAVGEVTDRLRGLYLHEGAAAKWVRNNGLRRLNQMPSAKAMLIDYAAN